MSASATPPFRRNVSAIVRVRAEDFDGPCLLEVQRQEWRNPKTGRYRTVWSARRTGRLGWDASSSLRDALKRAAYVRDGRRPAWLTAAVREAETQLAPAHRRSTTTRRSHDNP